jgi:hypothetical protein
MINDYMGNEAQEMMRQRALQAQMARPNQAQPQQPQQSAPVSNFGERGPSIPPPGNPPQPSGNDAAPPPSIAPLPQARDTSTWNTDGYKAPQYVPEKFASHPPPGWSREKWNNPNHQTPKYAVGRILSNFEPRTENGAAAAAEVAKAYPGTTYNGKDKITIPGVGTIDFIQGASVGGKGWRWGTEAGDAAVNERQAAAGGGGGLGNPFADLGNMTSESTYSKLLGRINRSTPELTNQQALMALLTQ